jgi:hypothetical protein
VGGDRGHRGSVFQPFQLAHVAVDGHAVQAEGIGDPLIRGIRALSSVAEIEDETGDADSVPGKGCQPRQRRDRQEGFDWDNDGGATARREWCRQASRRQNGRLSWLVDSCGQPAVWQTKTMSHVAES